MTSLSCHLSRAEVGVLLLGWLWKSSSIKRTAFGSDERSLHQFSSP